MQISFDGVCVAIKNASEYEAAQLSRCPQLRRDSSGLFRGRVDLSLLETLNQLVFLPPALTQTLSRLRTDIHERIERERQNPDPVPLFEYPVKKTLYRHQIRAANMALLTFGWI